MKAIILIVEDDKDFSNVFSGILTDEGYDVVSAASYETAMTELSRNAFDLIFADIRLGDKSGIDLLRELRIMGIDVPVIVMTGFPEVDTACEALRLGAYDYIRKTGFDNILSLIKRALGGKTHIDELRQGRNACCRACVYLTAGRAMSDEEPHGIVMNKGTGEQSFGDTLRQIRMSKELTQDEVGERAGISWKYLGEIERGKKNPTGRIVLRLAEALGVPVCELMTKKGCPYGVGGDE